MTMPLPPFALERWFVEFEFVHGVVNACESGAFALDVGELLALEDGLEEGLRSLDLGYIENPGMPELRQTIARRYAGLGADDVRITTGASEAILLLLWTLVRDGDAVILPEPFYGSYETLMHARGAELRRLHLRSESDFRIDPEEIRALMADGKVRLVVLNPFQNPTGQAPTADEMRRIASLCEEMGARLLTDDVFRPVTLSAPVPLAAPELTATGVSIGDMSKPLGLGGVRVGWVATHDCELLANLSALRDYTTMCSGAADEWLATVALRHEQTLLQPRLERARRNLERLSALVQAHPAKLRLVPPIGGYSAFLEFVAGEGASDTRAMARRLVEQHRLLIMPGGVFGAGFERFVRIGLSTEEKAFERLMDLLGAQP